MGLVLCVGLFADLRENDPEAMEFHRENFEQLNRVLMARGMEAHVEPLDGDCWDAEMFGYSGLHYLRRAAAHLELRGQLPEPGNQDSSDDPVLLDYYDRASGTTRGIRRLLGRRKPVRLGFDHLILHSDTEGYYLPVDFAEVILGDPREPIAGGMVGSSQRLLAECDVLLKPLGTPPAIDPESDELWDAADAQGEGAGWERYGVESFTCVRLREAARRSIQEKSAIVFS